MARTKKRRSHSRRLGASASGCATLTSIDEREAMEAYGDTSGAGSAKRKLEWRGTLPLDVESFCKVAKKAIPNGYNEFDADNVCRVLRTEPEVCAVLAREMSPAVYVTGKPKALANLKRRVKAARADKAHIEKPKLHFWWD